MFLLPSFLPIGLPIVLPTAWPTSLPTSSSCRFVGQLCQAALPTIVVDHFGQPSCQPFLPSYHSTTVLSCHNATILPTMFPQTITSYRFATVPSCHVVRPFCPLAYQSRSNLVMDIYVFCRLVCPQQLRQAETRYDISQTFDRLDQTLQLIYHLSFGLLI